jgi:hypothetical protein
MHPDLALYLIVEWLEPNDPPKLEFNLRARASVRLSREKPDPVASY